MLTFAIAAAYFGLKDHESNLEYFRSLNRKAVVPAVVVPKSCLTPGHIALTVDGIYNPNLFIPVPAMLHLEVSPLMKPVKIQHSLGLKYSGADPSLMSPDDLKRAVIAQLKLFRDIYGVVPAFIRLPWNTTASVQSTVSSLGLQITGWSLDPSDQLACSDSAKLAENGVGVYTRYFDSYKSLSSRASPIVIHNSNCNISKELNDTIQVSKKYNYTYVSYAECLGLEGQTFYDLRTLYSN